MDREVREDRLLLDTHVLVWWATGSERLGDAVVQRIAAADEVRVSAVSLWELVLKESTAHPMVGTADAGRWFADAMAASSFDVLDITVADIGAVQHLPPIHRDPFDRLLIAQAERNAMRLVTKDSNVQRYPIATLPVP
jgi:PIN domain nuclease of toxin-antitoxin system